MTTRTVRIDLGNGDSYIGEVHSQAGDVIVLRNYAAWYLGDASPYNSPYPDDEVQLRLDEDAEVTTF